MKPLSIYIHIPFCERKCNYCDFLSFQSTEKDQMTYVQALIDEIISYKKYKEKYNIKSIFVGGGTPSILMIKHMKAIFEALKASFVLGQDIEITVEINPGTVDKEKLKAYKEIGINRLSIGLQSTEDDLLKMLGRIHNYETFLKTYKNARQVGFENINIDLIFGLSNQKIDQWERTLRTITDLGPEHISCYSLIIEEGTPYFDWYKEGVLQYPDEEIERNMYHMAIEFLGNKGYQHYEISNFSKPGYESYHNLTYWTGKEYLGVGLGASSYLNKIRYKNPAQLESYIGSAQALKDIRMNSEPIKVFEEIEEFMFLGLRLIKGVSTETFYQRFHQNIEEVYGEQLKELERMQLIQRDDNFIHLTSKGIDVSNYVFEKFLL
jgi:oxygen-independent coproporphyrinogen-3 oxidase